MSNISLQKQKDDTGCGIACVAMISNRSYEETLESSRSILNWGSRKTTFYTRAKELQILLEKTGISSEFRYADSWEKIEGCCIVGVNPNDDGRTFHWVIAIKDEKRFWIIDPEDGKLHKQGKSPAQSADNYRLKGRTKYLWIDKNFDSVG